MDDQVKVRGFRVEPGEVRTVLERHPDVGQAVVSVREGADRTRQLVAWVEPASGAAPPVDTLRSFLSERLPEYMVPSAIGVVEAFPMTPNGKVDRARLPDPQELSVAAGRVPPRNPTEEVLAGIFAEVLGIDAVGVHDDFFDLGGDSLLSLRVVDRAMHAGLSLGADTLFRHPTVAALTKVVRTTSASGDGKWSSLVSLRTAGTRRPLFLVHTTPGDVFGYARLVRRLGPDQPCYGLQALGLSDPTLAHRSIEAQARYYIEQIRTIQPHGPYLLGGWCYGGMVAFEMASQLRVQGEPIGLVALIEAVAPWPAPGTEALRYAGELGRAFARMGPVGWSDWIAARALRLHVDKRTAAEILEVEIGQGPLANREVVSEINLRAFYAWRPRFYDGTVAILRSSDRRPGTIDHPTMRWTALARHVRCYSVSGAHHEVLQEPHVGMLAAHLGEALDEAAGRAPDTSSVEDDLTGIDNRAAARR